MPFTVATWNVNSIRARLTHVVKWCQELPVNILAIQETKVANEHFPVNEFERLGYQVLHTGEKAYNGVALLIRGEYTEVSDELVGVKIPQKRFIAATIDGIRVINVYVPNGESLISPKYEYKLIWLELLRKELYSALQKYDKVIVLGDFNIAPHAQDVHDPTKWEGTVLTSLPEREAFKNLLRVGYKDLYRELNPNTQEFTWWDYRQGSFQRNFGLRIDHILVNSKLLSLCNKCNIDRKSRSWVKPSDHGIVIATFKTT